MAISTSNAGSGESTPIAGHVSHVGTLDEAPRPRVHMFRGFRARQAKYFLDRIIAIFALLILTPFLLTIAIAVRFSSPGPALFSHERIGMRGRPFRMWKFRSMRTGADEELTELLRAHGRDSEPLFKVPGDPRVTWIGHWLRRWSLDELPQLWNVALGHMSLIGPRPQVKAEVELYGERERQRLDVRPGLTGLWQVNGRSELTWKEAIRLDLYYVENWSLLLDLRILARTIGAVLSGRGAN